MKKRSILPLLICFLTFGALSAQSYDTALGVRLGNGIGLTGVQRLGDKFTLEAMLESRLRKDLTTVTLLGRQHLPLLFKRFNVFTGIGLHKGWYSLGDDAPASSAHENPWGATLLAGMEISIGNFNIAYDYRPSFNVSGGEGAFDYSSAISMRYILRKRPTKFQKWKKERRKNREKRKKERQRKRRERERNGEKEWWEIWK